MRLADDARRCVVYIGLEGQAGSFEAAATAFFIKHDGFPYLVTAKHATKPFEYAPFDIRFNLKTGEGTPSHVDNVNWFFHPDPDGESSHSI